MNETIKSYAKYGDLDKLRQIHEESDITAEFDVLISIAAGYGQLEILIWLETLGAKSYCLNNNPYGNACKYGRLEVIKYLLQNPNVDPLAQSGYGYLAASEKDHDDIVKYLLINNLVPVDYLDHAPLEVALNNGSYHVTKLLLEHGELLDKISHTFRVVCHGWIDLLDQCQIVTDDQLCITAAKFNHLDILQQLIEKYHLDPNCDNSKTLMYGCSNNNYDMVEYLERFNPDWNSRDMICIRTINKLKDPDARLLARVCDIS